MTVRERLDPSANGGLCLSAYTQEGALVLDWPLSEQRV